MCRTTQLLPEEMLGYYARGNEEARLVQNAEGLLERARTEELLQRFLPPPPTLVLYAVISRFASALDGLGKHLFDDPVYQAIVRQDLAEGQHRDGQPDGTRGWQSYFTTAYLHRPQEIAEELVAAGLQHETTLAIE